MHIKLLLESKQCGIEIRKFIRIFKRNTLKEKILLCQLDSDYNITLSEKLCMVWYKKMLDKNFRWNFFDGAWLSHAAQICSKGKNLSYFIIWIKKLPCYWKKYGKCKWIICVLDNLVKDLSTQNFSFIQIYFWSRSSVKRQKMLSSVFFLRKKHLSIQSITIIYQ